VEHISETAYSLQEPKPPMSL